MSKPLKLTDREWRAFKVSEIFPSIQRGKRIKRADHVEGNVPYVSASALNNGVDGFIGNREGIRVFANCLSLANSGSVGSAFFHPYAFVASDHVTKLEREGADRYIYLFFPPVFSRMAERYGFNHEISDARITRERIMLPVISDGTPDWAFMSAYMRQEEKVLMKEAISRLKRQLAENHAEPVVFKGREWRAFVFGKEFSISSTSSSIDRKKLSEGDSIYPYITRSDNQNGVDSFVCSQEGYKMDEGNVITIGLDTQTVFYQPSAFYTGQNIQVVRHPKLNRHNALFVIRAIKILVQKFSWGSYGATLTRLKRGRLYLPITPDGTPDWAFMSAYMQGLEREMLREALAYFKEKIR
jgi:putative type II site-specific deoxyribonuclease